MALSDILLDPATGDLMFANGDLVIGDAAKQTERLLLLSEPGDAKDVPNAGVGLFDFLNSNDIGGLIGKTHAQLVLDGAAVKLVNYVNGILQIDAEYGGSY